MHSCLKNILFIADHLGLAQPGVVWKLNKALYGLRTSPKAWEEERDQKLQNLTWNLNGQQVGLCKVDSANCVWTIREKTRRGFPGGATRNGHCIC